MWILRLKGLILVFWVECILLALVGHFIHELLVWETGQPLPTSSTITYIDVWTTEMLQYIAISYFKHIYKHCNAMTAKTNHLWGLLHLFLFWNTVN